MVTKRVKSLWQGKVSIHEKYIKKAIDERSDLEIVYNDEVMTIKNEDLQNKIIARSETPFVDKYSNESYWLYYYTWKPDLAIQNSLL